MSLAHPAVEPIPRAAVTLFSQHQRGTLPKQSWKSVPSLLLRHWLAASGLDPDRIETDTVDFVLRATITATQRQGELLTPMHWTDSSVPVDRSVARSWPAVYREVRALHVGGLSDVPQIAIAPAERVHIWRG